MAEKLADSKEIEDSVENAENAGQEQQDIVAQIKEVRDLVHDLTSTISENRNIFSEFLFQEVPFNYYDVLADYESFRRCW